MDHVDQRTETTDKQTGNVKYPWEQAIGSFDARAPPRPRSIRSIGILVVVSRRNQKHRSPDRSVADTMSDTLCSSICNELLIDSIMDESDDDQSHSRTSCRSFEADDSSEEENGRVLTRSQTFHEDFILTDDGASTKRFKPFALGRRRHMRQVRHKAAEVQSTQGLELWRACDSGDLLYVQQTVSFFPHLIHLEQQGRTPLFLACKAGHVNIAELLLKCGAVDTDGTVYASSQHPECRALLQQYKIVEDRLNGTPPTEDASQGTGSSCSTPRIQNLSSPCFSSPKNEMSIAVRAQSLLTTSVASSNLTPARPAVSDIREVINKEVSVVDKEDCFASARPPDRTSTLRSEESNDTDNACHEAESESKENPIFALASEEDDAFSSEEIEYGERDYLVTKNQGRTLLTQASSFLLRGRTRSSAAPPLLKSSPTCFHGTIPMGTVKEEEESVIVSPPPIFRFVDEGNKHRTDAAADVAIESPEEDATAKSCLGTHSNSEQSWTSVTTDDDIANNSLLSGTITHRSGASTCSESDRLTSTPSDDESAKSLLAEPEDLEVGIEAFRIVSAFGADGSKSKRGRPFLRKTFALLSGKSKETDRKFENAESTSRLHITVSIEEKDSNDPDGNETDEMSSSEDDSKLSDDSPQSEKYNLYSVGEQKSYCCFN